MSEDVSERRPELARAAQVMSFSWVEPDRLAGCRGPHTGADLALLHAVGIRAVVRLAQEADVTPDDVRAAGLDDHHEAVPDFTAPTPDQLDRSVAFIAESLRNGRPVAVSCGAGRGRTGTVLACYLASEGRPAAEAIDLLVQRRPVCEELTLVPGQREAVEAFVLRLRHDATGPLSNADEQ